jgi:hypothetical protein
MQLAIPDGYLLVEYFGTHNFSWIKSDTVLPLLTVQDITNPPNNITSSKALNTDVVNEAQQVIKWINFDRNDIHDSNFNLTPTSGSLMNISVNDPLIIPLSSPSGGHSASSSSISPRDSINTIDFKDHKDIAAPTLQLLEQAIGHIVDRSKKSKEPNEIKEDTIENADSNGGEFL